MQKKILLILFLSLGVNHSYAKTKLDSVQSSSLKIGYTNMEYLLSFLPEKKKIESEYASFEKQIKNQLATSVGEFKQKWQDFEQGYETMTEEVRNKKESELQQLQGDLEKLQIELQEKLTSKHTNLLKPIYEKITQAIEQVAKEQGYTHVFNANVGNLPVLLYADEQYNVSMQVLQKLGVTLEKTSNKKKNK
mmetsp:Transcript_3879/g.8752  ORF Transcript_3879/g.8752 Transcript_3879/m.8752 type:complete len:192 (+) Transcript_3879:5541-6116(+)